jgi:hypothetical protein
MKQVSYRQTHNAPRLSIAKCEPEKCFGPTRSLEGPGVLAVPARSDSFVLETIADTVPLQACARAHLADYCGLGLSGGLGSSGLSG